MATNFMNFKTKHGVVGTGDLLATTGGAHIRNIKATADIDNGSIVGCGDYQKPDYYAETDAGTFSGKIIDIASNGNFIVDVISAENCWLVATVPVIYEEQTQQCTHESNFYNAKDDLLRCIELKQYDRFEASKECFSGSPQKGSTLTVASKKLTVGE